MAVDAVTVGSRATGAARFLVNLLAHLPTADPARSYVAFVTAAGADVVRARAPEVDLRVVDPGRGRAWETRGVVRAAAGAGADLLVTVREVVPGGSVPVLVHIFEPPAYRLRAFGRPIAAEAKRYAKDVVLHAALRRSLRRARAVTAGSEATADWLRRRTGVAAEVVLPGIDPVFFEAGAELPAGPPYVLYVSSGDPRDNADLVLRAFASGRCEGLRLVVAGGGQADMARRAGALGVPLESAGWVTDERLRDLYRGAVALVHPTKYEGFAGYPALEAMAVGTPVVALAAPGATEALAGRALLVPRADAALFADAVARLRDDPELRAELSARGREFAGSLTWEASAAAFAATIARALDRAG